MKEKRRLLLRIKTCPFCIRAEEALKTAGIEYETLDINPADRSLVQALSGQPSVPILVEVTGCKDQDDDIIAAIPSMPSKL
mgnify:CR=1 FL=1